MQLSIKPVKQLSKSLAVKLCAGKYLSKVHHASQFPISVNYERKYVRPQIMKQIFILLFIEFVVLHLTDNTISCSTGMVEIHVERKILWKSLLYIESLKKRYYHGR